MIKKRIFLTISTLLSGIGSPLFVYAQNNAAPAVIKSDLEKRAEKNDGKKKNTANNVESIAVFGHGSTRQTMSIGRASMQQSVPGTSALKVLNELPGVLYQSADPFGVYEYSSQIFMRGFSQSQLGFTLDDVPLGDQQFNNYNGLGITRAIISDNIGNVNVSQGAGGIDVASTSNLGGAVEIHSMDPSHKRGGAVSQTFGSNATFRTFARLDSGDLNESGTRFSVSYARLNGDLWKGHGYDHSDQVNAKLVQPLARESSFKVFFDWSSTQQFDYQDMTKNWLSTAGSSLSNYYPDYTAAYQAAQGTYPAQISKTNDPKDAAYYAGTANRVDYLGGVTLDENLTSNLNWKTTLYGHADTGYSTWTTPYKASPNGAPLSQRVQQPQVARGGFESAVTWKVARHTLNAGVWYEYGNFETGRYFSQAPFLGQGTLGNPTNGFPGDKIFATAWHEAFSSNTFVFHMQDTYRVTDTLKINAGFKSMIVNAGNSVLAQDQTINGKLIAQGRLEASNAFLPQISANWRFLPHHELFFDVSHNMRSFPEDGFATNISASPWTASQASFQETKKNLRPETDWVYEGGYRFSSQYISALASLYRINFSNRLQLITNSAGINPITAVQNVGGVTTNGAEASITLRPVHGLSIYNSFSYAHSTYDQNVVTSNGLQATRGKLVPNYPQFMYKANIAYQLGDLNLHVDGSYISRRELTYTNDLHVPGYFLMNFGARYNFGDAGPFKGINASFNIYNLANKTYIATTNELGNNFVNTGYNYFLMGAPRQFFGTISTAF
ncbi:MULTISPECIES: TonB-dependent receptor [Acetobacter]|uniref:Iron complex outermembrane receptor protein n=2 Tax=Acetobacter TaxID=434 RepID=A0A841QGK7_9PROT|nr:TonB-dependent receptor [Acetobacter lovaniensis]MBB6457548.1 iron complex outermembrane receptor protein [Acetobacter lovaniensis]NHN81840.1 TonB-dependent receptor [Acetobacter lovaniensis]